MSRTIRTFCLTMSCLALTLVPSMARAVVVIDTFDEDQTTTDTDAGGGGVGTSSAGAATIIGSFRDVYVEKTAPVTGTGAIVGRAEGGEFNVDRGSRVGGVVLVQWDGDAAPPAAFVPESNLKYLLGGLDLTEMGANLGIELLVKNADLAPQTLTFKLFSNKAGDPVVSSTLTKFVGAAAPPELPLLFPFAEFGGTADLTKITAITLSITGPIDSNLTIDLLQTYVPEPASASLLGVGLVATLARFRRRRREVATS